MKEGGSGASAARRRVVQQLMRVEETRAFVGLLNERDPDDPLSPREERQVRDSVAGVIRWRRWLDFLISRFVRGNAEALEPALRQILRLGLYELTHTRTAPHAAVNEAVELTRAMVRPQAAGLTNGVLRSVLRSIDQLPEPDDEDPAERLSVRFSHPTWMVRRWLGRFGEEGTTALLRANNDRPTFGLRVNTRRTTVGEVERALAEEGVASEPSPYINYFLRVSQLQPVRSGEFFRNGLVAVQDEAAGLVVKALHPQPAERILDLCAAPGGKALHAVQLMDDRGELLAVDVHEGRLSLVEQAARAHGVSIVRVLAADGRTLTPERIGHFDRVLLDAPCTGTGVLARRADLRWNRSEDDLHTLMELQRDLLSAAGELVSPGGVLVYATCSIEPEENELQVQEFLKRDARFALDSLTDHLPPAVVADHQLITLPQRHGIDGSYAARMRRTA